MSVPDAPLEEVEGTVERITFHSEETGFSVLQVWPHGGRDRVTVVGTLPPVSTGERITANGIWKSDPRFGLQFQAESISIHVPTGKEGIERYLASGLVKGVGPHLAKLMVRTFGDKTIEVIENEPRKLEKIRGIGPKRAAMIAESWAEKKSVRDLMLFLHQHGVGTARAYRIHKQYGANAIGLIRQNPYRLADEVRGIGFTSADSIARSLGFEMESPFRARAGLAWVLGEARSDGHCGLPGDDMKLRSHQLLEIPAPVVEQALRDELLRGTLARDTIRGRDVVFLASLYHQERDIAERLNLLAESQPPWPEIDSEKAVGWVERRLGMNLADSQKKAIRTVLRSKVSVITGGPGVGKTTIVDSILRILEVKGIDAALAAPTGRAAKRLSETTGRRARTIHRLLEVNAQTGQFGRDEDDPLDCDLLVVDEMSMVDVPLMTALMRAIPRRAGLLMVGDSDQLPSVGPGNVLGDIIASGSVPVIRLTEIFRQAKESLIVLNAHRINSGDMPDLAAPRGDRTSDFYFVAASRPDQALRSILRLVCERIPERFGLDPLRDVQILAPMHRGPVGVKALNAELQSRLNPSALTTDAKLERFGTTYAVGDRVMQIENDYDKDVFNGDIGVIRAIDPEEQILEAEFDGRRIEYESDSLDQLVLAYATTIHKSQGSEYPAVVIPLMTTHHIMLQRNLLYTAVTRGRQLVVIVGQRAAVERAVRNRSSRTRWTRLREWLGGERER